MLFVFAYSVQRNKLQILYNLDLALIASFYMIAAYNIKMFLVSKGQGLDIKMSYEKIFTILFISGLGLLLFYQRGSFVDWPSRSFNNPILDLVQTALGVMLTFAISLLIVRAPYFSKIMAEIGKASLVILCFHFLFFRLYFLILYFLGLTELNTLLKLTPPLGTSPVSLALLIIFSVLLTTGMAILLSRFEKTKSLFSL
jgi:fucose 4-O-acetylase-like acetyltransferase